MKSKTLRVLLFAMVGMVFGGCATFRPQVQPAVTTYEATSYADVMATVSLMNGKYRPQNVLIVLDIDNTILTSSKDLGSDIWYQWQRGKLAVKPGESQKVPCLFEDAIGLLYELVPMTPTEKAVPKAISDWQSAGNTVMALTSRAPKYRAATERELRSNKIDLELAALAPKGQKAPVYREMQGRELSYMKGVMMTSGMNKGEMLKYILAKTGRTFAAIVFVDDSQHNIDNVYAAFKENGKVDVSIFHYTHIEDARKKKYGAVLTQEQALEMDADWKALNATLNQLFPARDLQGGCLDSFH